MLTDDTSSDGQSGDDETEGHWDSDVCIAEGITVEKGWISDERRRFCTSDLLIKTAGRGRGDGVGI